MIKFFKCKKCGNIIVRIVGKNEDFDCCDEKMQELIPGEVDASVEKHIPSIIKKDNEIIVEVGEVLHPMEDKHYISFILLETTNGYQIKYLNSNDAARAIFRVDEKIIAAYEYCTLHGLWKKEL